MKTNYPYVTMNTPPPKKKHTKKHRNKQTNQKNKTPPFLRLALILYVIQY